MICKDAVDAFVGLPDWVKGPKSLTERFGDGYYPHLVTSFDQELSTEDTNYVLKVLSRYHVSQVKTTVGRAIVAKFQESLDRCDYRSIVLGEPDVLDLPPVDRLAVNQLFAFFRKREDLELGIDREAAAFQKFTESEASCRLTNECFRKLNVGKFAFHPTVDGILYSAQRKILSALGEFPAPANLKPRFGPGSSTQIPKKNACPLLKTEHVPACSANLAPFAGGLLSYMGWGSGQREYEIDVEIHDSLLDFAPKNAQTLRAVIPQPQLNSMWQLAYGDYISERLKRVGIDTHDQSKNQHWAWVGSRLGISATIDLTSASDTVAIGLVQHLLPLDWFNGLNKLRCDTVVYRGSRIKLEQFSSMGNGFTFPLMTLILWAIAKSVAEYHDAHSLVPTLVYGDDIIVPTNSAIPLIRVLRDLGFTPNQKKSFWHSGFRESCGCDYVDGTSVRPIFVDGKLKGGDFFRLYNHYAQLGIFSQCRLIEAFIEPTIRLRGPQGYGDGHLHTRTWLAKPAKGKGWCGTSFETWAHKPEALKREIALTFMKSHASDSTGSVDAPDGPIKKGQVLWKESCAFHIRRLATYVVSLNDDVDPHMKEPCNPPQDSDTITTPGKTGVTRTRIYIYEHPRLTKLPARTEEPMKEPQRYGCKEWIKHLPGKST